MAEHGEEHSTEIIDMFLNTMFWNKSGQRLEKQRWLFTPVMLLSSTLKIIKICVNKTAL